MGDPDERLARERRALQLFEAMLDLDEAERAAWLDSNASNDPELKRRITRMAEADRLLSLRTGGAFDDSGLGEAPEQLGAYRVTGLIGTGGMGSVYSATRMRGDFEHEVAIKLIKPGVLSQPLVERFRRERQLIARMNHPHIARLFDGGESENGQPYFVMERIEGVSLGTWLDKEAPSLEARTALFLQICDAVGYAHRQLVVHRDLTPANILIDRRGQAKLIDFGIARLAEDTETAPADAALGDEGFRAITLTPGYAAPERLRGDIATTLSDIYSAGRLLARMMPKPRGAELQAIINCASAPEPKDRYQTIDALARDVVRLREGRTVAPLAHRRGYRWGKFLRRHRIGLAIAAAALVAGVTGVTSLALAWREAELARAASEQRFAEVRELSTFMLYDLYDDLSDVPGTTVALNRIADRAREYLDRLSAVPGAPRLVRVETAMGYKRLSDVLGTPLAANLGRRDEAGAMLTRSVTMLRALHAETPDDRATTEALADALYSQAVFAFIALDDNDLAHRLATESARLYWQIATGKDEAKLALKAIDAEIEAALPLGWIGRGADGVAHLRQTLTRLGSHITRYGDSAEALAMKARLHSALAETIGREADSGKGTYADAAGEADQAIAAYRALILQSDKPDGVRRSMAASLYKRSINLYMLERYPAAIRDLEEAKTIIEGQIRRDAADAGLTRTLAAVDEQLALALAHAGKGQRAIALAEASTSSKRAAASREPGNPGLIGDLATGLLVAVEVAQVAGDRARACRLARESAQAFAATARLQPLSDYDRISAEQEIPKAIGQNCRV